MAEKIRTNFESRQKSIKQILNPNALFLSFLRGAIWNYNDIFKLFTYFASFIGHEDDILEVIFNLQIQGAKFGRKKDKLGGKSF